MKNTIITLASIALSGMAGAQTWVQNWAEVQSDLFTTSDGGALLTLQSDNLSSGTPILSFASDSNLPTETGSFAQIMTDEPDGATLTFSLPEGYVFTAFKMADVISDASITSTLGSGNWTIQETDGTGATLSGGGGVIHHTGDFIASASVNGLNSFTVFHNFMTEDSGIGFAYNATQVPEPSSTALLGLGALGLLVRRKR